MNIRVERLRKEDGNKRQVRGVVLVGQMSLLTEDGKPHGDLFGQTQPPRIFCSTEPGSESVPQRYDTRAGGQDFPKRLALAWGSQRLEGWHSICCSPDNRTLVTGRARKHEDISCRRRSRVGPHSQSDVRE